MLRKKLLTTFLFITILIPWQFSVNAQGTLIDFNSIPKSGTILINAHMDDDVIWMLPFWSKTEKFINGAMPSTPAFNTIVSQQQNFINNNGYNINYESNWFHPWGTITQNEYSEYYWNNNSGYQYLADDHLLSFWDDNNAQLVRREINRIKSKIEQFIADPGVSRIITHDNWGEYGHQHHKAVNKAVRELAVKYRKDVWMLGCTISNGNFADINVPNGITYTLGSFNTPDLFTGIRTAYQNNYCWTWYSDIVPSGDHKFIQIVEYGTDKSDILNGESVSYSGPEQLRSGAYIFDGDDDYLTLDGNNYSSFTISMFIRPDQIRAMDIAAMSEYPFSDENDRNIFLNSDGRITARIFDGSSKTVTSTRTIQAGIWSHVAITCNGSSLKLYINGIPDGTVSTGTAITYYSSPEFVLGQATETGSYFRGQISDVRLRNYVMSDTEIAIESGMIFTIASSAGAGGTIDPSGNTIVVAGTDRTFVISPATGYHIADVLVDGVSAGPVSTYTFTSVIANHTIHAEFVPSASYIITASAGSGGSISPSGDITVYEGTNQTFTITPAIGYRIFDLKIDGVSVSAVSSYTFSNITSSHTIEATFEITPTYTITASAGAGGSVIPAGVTTVNEGSDQIYNITPATGYKVSEVLADGISVGSVSLYTFSNITSNHTISATFELLTYTLTASAGAGGSISPSGSLTVTHGESQTYTFSPNTGYQISNVLIDNVSVGTPAEYTFNSISASHTINVLFSLITFPITASAGTGGSISPQGNVLVDYGTSQTFVINPNSGYYITDVKVDNISAGPITTYTFNNVMAGHTISATFTQITYTITGSAGPDGSIDPSGTITVNHGSDRTFAINPDFGFQVSDVRVDNVSVGAVTTYTFYDITNNHTISATFTTAVYTLNANAGYGGSISPVGTISAVHGTNHTFTITPSTGYKISDVRVDDVSVGDVSSYTFSNITSNHTISATFDIITYTIASSTGTGGSISPQGNVTVEYGSEQTFNITPNTGYNLSDVMVDNASIGPVSSYTFSNITGNHTISAAFSIMTFAITSNAGTGGNVSPAGTTRVNYGSSSTYTITPNVGFHISDVKIDNVSAGAISSYTFNNVTSDHTISAAFIPITFNISGTSGAGGSISPSGTITVNYGTNQVYSITPTTGYKIVDVKVDNKSVGPVSDYTFTNIIQNHTISASFSIITYIITAESNSGGSISPKGNTVVDHGSDLAFTFEPDYGFRVLDVQIDGISKGSASSLSLSNITDNHNISVIFKPITTYTISALPGRGGSITPSGSVTLFEGSDQTYSIKPEYGYRIQDVVVDNRSVGALSEYTFSNIITDHSISALFTTQIDVSVYPNPFREEFNIYIASPFGNLFELTISDLSGKIIYARSKIAGNTIIPINLKAPQGLYFVRLLIKGKKLAVIKVVKS